MQRKWMVAKIQIVQTTVRRKRETQHSVKGNKMDNYKKKKHDSQKDKQ